MTKTLHFRYLTDVTFGNFVYKCVVSGFFSSDKPPNIHAPFQKWVISSNFSYDVLKYILQTSKYSMKPFWTLHPHVIRHLYTDVFQGAKELGPVLRDSLKFQRIKELQGGGVQNPMFVLSWLDWYVSWKANPSNPFVASILKLSSIYPIWSIYTICLLTWMVDFSMVKM